MGKRTIAVGNIIDKVDWSSLWQKLQPRGNDYVSESRDGSLLAGLLWEEVHKIMLRARLTGYQRAIFRAWLQGWEPTAIGIMFPNPETGEPRHHETISQAIKSALCRIENVKHLGALTVMVESQGWGPVREYLGESRADGMLQFNHLPDNEKIAYCAMVTGDYKLLTMTKKQRKMFLESVQAKQLPLAMSI